MCSSSRGTAAAWARRRRRRRHTRRGRGIDGVRRRRARRPLLRVPALQRELSVRADPAAIRALRRIIRQRRPDILHTHTAKAGATGRLARRSSGARPAASERAHIPRPRPQRLFRPALERVFRWVERVLARTSGAVVAVSDEVRDDLVALRRRAARQVRRHPVRIRPSRRDGADDEARRGRAPRSARAGHIRRRLGGEADADQAPRRSDPDARALVENGVDALLVSSATARTAPPSRRWRPELGVAERCRLVGYQQNMRPWYASSTHSLLTSANEGTPVVAIEALAAGGRSWRPTRAARRPSSATARAATSCRSGTLPRWPPGWRISPATQSCARGSARAVPRTYESVSRSARMVDGIEELYRLLIA